MDQTVKKRDVNWITVLWYIHLHALGLYGLVLLFLEAKWLTLFFVIFIVFLAGLGLTLGAHRLWAHQSYQASFIVRLFLVLAHTVAGVGSIYDWVLAHRLHHRYYGTDKDPYNHKKGFIYSHLVSNVLTPRPDQEILAKTIDMRDVDSDGLIWIQRRLYWPLFVIVGLLLPINAPAEYWDESIKNSVFILGFARLAITLNLSWLVNSAMHIWGMNPGDKYPADDNTVFILHKSYQMNYHYLLPWDSKSGEFGGYDSGCTTFVLKIWEILGLVSGLKTASSEDVRSVLGKMATSKMTLQQALDEMERLAELETKKAKLRYHHG
ncbi:acyl-CoA Delta(11) desaturase [Cephus cinctus]|uniref:Acyl-CoA Delta(11) desaturase n=1 Tax=Cephus cinctus TaxID=211228 RepID=A0AAJ7FFW1_CEPCN|nr:acyl-CoA Delta(11) desaturase [Cephus cinctus]